MTDRPPFAPKARKRSATARGVTWERELERLHGRYLAEGVADMDRYHPPLKKTPDGWRPTGKGGVDFGGTLRGGRSISFDAKTVSKGSRFDLGKVPRHQTDRLLSRHHLRALSFFMVYFAEADLRVAFDMQAVLLSRADGRYSLRDDEGQPFTERDGWRMVPTIHRELERNP